MDTLFGFVKIGVIIAIVVFVLAAAAVFFGLHLHSKDLKREERDKILDTPLDDLVKKYTSTDANGRKIEKDR